MTSPQEITSKRCWQLNKAADSLMLHQEKESYQFSFGFREHEGEYFAERLVLQNGKPTELTQWLGELAVLCDTPATAAELLYLSDRLSNIHHAAREEAEENHWNLGDIDG